MRGLFVTLFFLVLTISLSAQWANFSGPGNGSINALLFDGMNLYAGVEGQSVHKSTDFGATWRGLYKGFGDATNTWGARSIRSLLVKGTKMYAGAYAFGLYVSTDKGETWVKNTSGVSSSATIRAMIAVGNDIYLGTAGVLKSTNDGVNWTNPSPAFSSAVNQLAYAGGVLFAVTDGKGVRASTDNGVTWVGRNNGIVGDTNSMYFSSIIAKGSTLFTTGTTGTSGTGKVYKSTDLGLNWTAVNQPISSFSGTKLHVSANGNIYMGMNNAGTYRTTNDGGVWTKLDSLKDNPFIVSFASYGDTIFAGGNSGLFAGSSGIFRSTNGGLLWKNTITQMGFTNISVLTGKDNYMYCGTTAGNNTWAGGMYVSSNYGLTWEYRGQGFNWYNVSAILPLGNVVLAGVATNVAQGISRSTDYGKTWAFSNTGLPQYAIINKLILNGSTVIAAVGDGGFNNHYGGMYYSTDQGATWTKNNTGLPTEPDMRWVAMWGSNLYAAHGGSKLYKSTNNGTSWTEVVPTGFPQFVYPEKFFIYKDKMLVPTLYNGLYASSDGVSFAALGTGLGTGSDWQITALAGSDTVLYAATSVKGVYRSSNGGQNWYAYNEGMPSGYNLQLYVNGPLIYTAGPFNAVWARYLFGTTGIEDNAAAAARGYSLEQNYPNPFNPSTTIRYSLSDARNVSLRVYDMLGKEVAVLVSGMQSAGEHSIRFDGVGLASGIYLYKLETGGSAITRKFVLMK